MKRTIMIIFLFALIGMTAGCVTAGADPDVLELTKVSAYMCRVIDREAGVVCWTVSRDYGSVGLSCLPLAETNLK
jgi:predicted small secreted protein